MVATAPDRVVRARLLDLVTEASRAATAAVRLEILIDGFADVCDGEVGGYNHVDLESRRTLVLMRPQVVDDPIGDLREGYREHPVVRHYQRRPGSSPVVLSSCDLGRWRRWKDHPAYATLFRPMGTPHEIVIPVPAGWGPFRGETYAVTRSGRDFGDREIGIAHAAQRLLAVLHQGDATLGATGRLELLTAAERNVLQLYGLRLSETDIAAHRGASPSTVHTQLREGCAKLGLAGRNRRAAIARVFGFLPPLPLPADRLARLLDA